MRDSQQLCLVIPSNHSLASKNSITYMYIHTFKYHVIMYDVFFRTKKPFNPPIQPVSSH